MVVVSLQGGPKKLLFENKSDRPSFVDLERDNGPGKPFDEKRYEFGPRERRYITVQKTGKYVNVITTTDMKLVAVEEL